MLIEIMGGPHDGATINIGPAEKRLSYVTDTNGAAAFFAGIPLHMDGDKVYVRWVELEAWREEIADSLRSIGPAIDRLMLAMHEHEFGEDT